MVVDLVVLGDGVKIEVDRARRPTRTTQIERNN